ncbi:MAG: response regulator transcription factor [Rhodothermaceae bacterium]|nr:response regulator transcription factor [Rhodothermaceae bacterium]
MHESTTVLLAEDDINLGQVLSEYLVLKGYTVFLHRDGLAAWDGYIEQKPNLCILDVMMPKQDGFTLAARIREIDTNIPIIFLTAKNMQEDRIEGFTLGGDDYITKPFSMQELLLRVQAIMRRIHDNSPGSTINNCVQLGSMQFKPSVRELRTSNDQVLSLTNKESQLLELLARYKNKTLPRTEALNRIWGDDTYYNARSMDVYITKLRKLLKPDENLQIITVHGEGFRLVER